MQIPGIRDAMKMWGMNVVRLLLVCMTTGFPFDLTIQGSISAGLEVGIWVSTKFLSLALVFR